MVKEKEGEEASIARLSFSPSLLLPLLLLFPLILCSSFCSAQGNQTSDANALLDFKNHLTKGSSSKSLASWNASSISSICTSWLHVGCSNSTSSGRVTWLRLQGISLQSPIAPNTIGLLDALQNLTLRSTKLSGSLPQDFANLKALQQLVLSFNRFSGPLPSSLSLLPLLSQLDLSFNSFSGSIPASLQNLSKLESLYLQNNSLSGAIPPLAIASLEFFNVSNNHLNGSIPRSLAAKFNASSFMGNPQLCGSPLPACKTPSHSAPAPAPAPESKSKKLRKGAIVGIACGAAAAVLLLLFLLDMLWRRKKQRSVAGQIYTRWIATSSTTVPEGNHDQKLVFIDGKKLFELDDLLCASADLLGKGTLGRSYKTVLENGLTVVTKRLQHVDESRREEYLQRINDIAGLKHDNLLRPRAYYCGEAGYLLVYDLVANGSLSAGLHGEERKPLDWEARVRIAATSARGLASLHAHDMVHGNLKPNNVLLMSNMEARLVDYHMLPLTKFSATPYLAPEVTDPQATTPQADVFSFGVLLLELLTAKTPLLPSPSAPSAADSHTINPIDLPHWVESVARDKWIAEVLDPSLLQSGEPLCNEEEMLNLLQLAMTCVAPPPDQRPSMLDIVQTMDQMCRTHDDDDGKALSP